MRLVVKLRDSSSIFHDPEQDITLVGKSSTKVKQTERVVNALRGGALILVEQLSEDKKSEDKKSNKDEQKNKDVSSTVIKEAAL